MTPQNPTSDLSGPPATRANPSGQTDPCWYAAADVPAYAPLATDASADVCVVGAGIAGLTTAYLLAKAGKSVVVVDAKPIAGGETGRTSAHLASAIDDRFSEIERMHGVEGSRIQYESHAAAIDLIEQICRDENIDCGFKRLDGYLLLAAGDKPDKLQKEFEAAQRAGFRDVWLHDSCPIDQTGGGCCLRFGNQARFQPLQYLAGLARKLSAMGVRIYCGSFVNDMKTENGQVKVTTREGQTVTAQFGVAATNVPAPINNWAGIYTKVAPYRTYMVGLRVPRGAVADALYWDTLDAYHYARLDSSGGDESHDVLIVGGEDHKTGQHATRDEQVARFESLENWTRQHFPQSGDLVFRWSGQVYEPDDAVAFIGRVPTGGHENCFCITGDSGMGLTHGTLGAKLISDLILGRENPWAKLYDPARKSMLKSATEFVKENVNAVAQYADYVTPGEVSGVDEISPGTGAIVRRGLKKVAVYRGQDGTLHECSAICTHLGGIVHWNDAEKSWDCPVHGSRFDCQGKVLTGPAVSDLSSEEKKG